MESRASNTNLILFTVFFIIISIIGIYFFYLRAEDRTPNRARLVMENTGTISNYEFILDKC
jgi:hypothetical protein